MNGLNDFKTELGDVQYSPGYLNELEHKLKCLEQQNKELGTYKQDCERLSMELQHILTLKETYEEKYHEASMKLICIDDDDSFVFTETEQLKTLNEKIAILMHANQDLRNEVETSKKDLLSAKTERDKYKAEVAHVQSLIQALYEIKQTEKEVMTDPETLNLSQKSPEDSEPPNSAQTEHETSETEKNYQTSLESPFKHKDIQLSLHDAQFSKTEPDSFIIPNPLTQLSSPKLSTTNSNFPPTSPKQPKSRRSPKAKLAKKAKTSYIPSFMRTKLTHK